MKLKDSNITCVFVSSGFPDNRSCFYRKVPEFNEELLDQEEEDEEEDEEEEEDDDIEDVEEGYSSNKAPEKIEGREGDFQKSVSLIGMLQGQNT